MIVAELASRKAGSILAIDADPNSCFADYLGIKCPETIVGICNEISKNMDKIPAGMSKDRYIEMRVQESVTETGNFDMLVMGVPEGPGCYCYVNNLLRSVIGRIAGNYDHVVIDNAAGMEHISRRTAGNISELVLVSDYSAAGIRSAKRIYDLAGEMRIAIGRAMLVVNRVSGPLSAIKKEIADTGLDLAGEIPYSAELSERSLVGKPVSGFGPDSARYGIGKICDRFMESSICR